MTTDRDIRQFKSRDLGNLDIVCCIPLYLMIWRDYQNNWTNDYRRLSFVRQGVPKTVSCSCGCCGGAVDSIISVYKQLDGSGFNLKFEI